MRTKISKTIVMILAFIGFVSFLGMPTKAEALEPRLLWEKTMPFKIHDIKMAAESGDVILSSEKQIILFDKNGNKRFHWGPRIDRAPFEVGISDDGSKITYQTSWTIEYMEAKKLSIPGPSDARIHYSTRKGKELWNKKMDGGATYLSPDGQFIAIGSAGGEGDGLILMDSTGKILWKYPLIAGSADVIFSPDSNYITLTDEDMGEYSKLRLFDKSGTVIWEKPYSIGTASISENASYISIYPYEDVTHPDLSHNGKVYDKNGNIILDGFGVLSKQGNRIVMLYSNKTSILNLPTKDIFKEYLVQSSNAMISADGRYLALVGKGSISSNLFIFDVQGDKKWETYIPNITNLFLTNDGKYLLIHSSPENKLFYYQLY